VVTVADRFRRIRECVVAGGGCGGWRGFGGFLRAIRGRARRKPDLVREVSQTRAGINDGELAVQ